MQSILYKQKGTNEKTVRLIPFECNGFKFSFFFLNLEFWFNDDFEFCTIWSTFKYVCIVHGMIVCFISRIPILLFHKRFNGMLNRQQTIYIEINNSIDFRTIQMLQQFCRTILCFPSSIISDKVLVCGVLAIGCCFFLSCKKIVWCV